VIEPWELVLHHTYAGTPGVAFDLSPSRSAHGSVVDLEPWNFLQDGYADGSGAVRFRNSARIRVDPPGGWQSLSALKAEIVFKLEEVDEWGGHLFETTPRSFWAQFSSYGFSFGCRVPPGSSSSPAGTRMFSVGLTEHGVDPGSWIRAGILHDGVNTVQISLNGRLVETFQNVKLGPLPPINTLTIGNNAGGQLPSRGLIDEVKVWRPNPARMTSDFTVRIVKGGLTDCWVKWGKQFRVALRALADRDVECPDQLTYLLREAMHAMAASAMTHNAATRAAWQQTVADYRRLWSQGNVGEIGPVLGRLLATLRAEGVPIEQHPAYRNLVDNHCFQDLLALVPPLDCDPQFTRMVKGGN